MVNVIAHRGFSGRHPENTLTAFQAAIELGVDMVEFDVQLTADGEIVVIHDDRVDRTTDGEGAVENMTLGQIQALRILSVHDREPVRVPTFREVLDLLEGSVRLNINLKPTARTRAALAERVANEFAGRRLHERAFVAADDDSLTEMARRDPSIARCSLDTQPPAGYITRSIALGCRILQPGHAMVDATFVAEAHEHGLEVNVFFANTESEMTAMILAEVDGVLTDHPDALTQLIHGGAQ